MNISPRKRLIKNLEIIASRIYTDLRNAGFPFDSVVKQR